MGFTKEFFEQVIKCYGNKSVSGGENTSNPDKFFYLYFKDAQSDDGHDCYEEDTFAINPLDGVLEVIELEVEKGNDVSRSYIPYENIIRFFVAVIHGTDQ